MPYAGVATRALAIDVAIAQVIVFAGGAILALVGSLVADVSARHARQAARGRRLSRGRRSLFRAVLEHGGPDPGMRLMGLRVLTRRGEHPGVTRSGMRLIGLGLAIVPLFLGFLPVLINTQRRGLHDFLAGTVVLYAGHEPPPPPVPAAARASSHGRLRTPG